MISPFATLAPRQRIVILFAWLVLCANPAGAQETPLVLMIQPMLGEETTRRMFQPLADYLGKEVGTPVTIVTPPNFLAHWETVRRNIGYDLVLDDAHFTDYRVQKFGFDVLARIPGTTSYSLVMLRKKRVIDPLDLAGKTVASYGPPSIGATRLSAMFPNPARRPAIVDIGSAGEGLDLLRRGKVTAAMLPTSLIGTHVGTGELAIVTTTEPTPQMAFSISPRVKESLRKKIRAVLLRAGDSTDGTSILRAANVDRFETADAAMYANQAKILKQYWGY